MQKSTAKEYNIMNILKIKRRIIDFLHKYASDSQIIMIAKLLNIKIED